MQELVNIASFSEKSKQLVNSFQLSIKSAGCASIRRNALTLGFAQGDIIPMDSLGMPPAPRVDDSHGSHASSSPSPWYD